MFAQSLNIVSALKNGKVILVQTYIVEQDIGVEVIPIQVIGQNYQFDDFGGFQVA